MKPRQRSLLILGVLLVGVTLTAVVAQQNLSESSPPLVSEEPTMAADSFEKLSPALRLRLSQRSVETNASANLLLQTDATLTPDQRVQLEAAGAKVRTVAGDIVTATVPWSQIPTLAELEFVRSIESSTSLYPESRP